MEKSTCKKVIPLVVYSLPFRTQPISCSKCAVGSYCVLLIIPDISHSFGGADNEFYYNDIWCFDPQTSRWDAVPAYGSLPASRQGHSACVINDTMYIYGGMNFEDQLLGDLSAFKFTGNEGFIRFNCCAKTGLA